LIGAAGTTPEVRAHALMLKAQILQAQAIALGDPMGTAAQAKYREMAQAARLAAIEFQNLSTSAGTDLEVAAYYGRMVIAANGVIAQVLRDHRVEWARTSQGGISGMNALKNFWKELAKYIPAHTMAPNVTDENGPSQSSAVIKNLLQLGAGDPEQPRNASHGWVAYSQANNNNNQPAPVTHAPTHPAISTPPAGTTHPPVVQAPPPPAAGHPPADAGTGM
jgi:hypothetical protein